MSRARHDVRRPELPRVRQRRRPGAGLVGSADPARAGQRRGRVPERRDGAHDRRRSPATQNIGLSHVDLDRQRGDGRHDRHGRRPCSRTIACASSPCSWSRSASVERLRRLAARAAELEKPIVMMKVGTSALAAEIALTHTGALVGDDRLVDAALRQFGIVRVDSLEQLAITAGLLAQHRAAAAGRASASSRSPAARATSSPTEPSSSAFRSSRSPRRRRRACSKCCRRTGRCETRSTSPAPHRRIRRSSPTRSAALADDPVGRDPRRDPRSADARSARRYPPEDRGDRDRAARRGRPRDSRRPDDRRDRSAPPPPRSRRSG